MIFSKLLVLEENPKTADPNAEKVRLSMKYKEVFTTTILITIDGGDFKFTSNLSKAVIVETSIPEFEALKSSGTLSIKLENVGDNDAKFEVSLKYLFFYYKYYNYFSNHN